MNLSYRDILSNELERRKKLNAAYSMRAFARYLGLSAPQLSTVLNGTKGLSGESAQRIAKKLDLSKLEYEVFNQSVEAQHSRAHKGRKSSAERLKVLLSTQGFKTIDEARFSPINEWYYISILQSFELRDFEPDAKWIASKLGISKDETDKAMLMLVKVGLLEQTRSFYKPSQDFVKSPDISSRAIRFYLQQMMMKASQALETQGISERDFSSTVFPINSRRIKEFKEKLSAFREDFCQDASRGNNKDEIYNLSVQFYKITKTKESL